MNHVYDVVEILNCAPVQIDKHWKEVVELLLPGSTIYSYLSNLFPDQIYSD